MWQQVKQAIVDGTREICSSVIEEGGNSKSVCWNNEVKLPVKKKKAGWKKMRGARD